MEHVPAVLLLFALGAPVGLAGAWFVTGGATGIARAFQPTPPLEWPHGVQEDDDFHWTWSGAGAVEPEPDPPPAAAGAAWIEELPIGAGPAARPIRQR
jgi:hypothetical protein